MSGQTLLKSQNSPRHLFTVLLALELGALVRLLPVALSSFPLNDGGLFHQMTQELVASGLRLPLLTTYNGGDIPFAYPPLGFYLAASLHLATGISVLELMRWLPAIFSILTLVPFYMLAKRLLADSGLASLALIAFALIPRSSEWMLMGGGLARSPGMFFSMLCLLQADQLLERRTWRGSLGLGVWMALAVLSHLEFAWFTAFSIGLLWLFRGRERASLGRVAVGMVLALVLASPWWIAIAHNHGVATFVRALLSAQHGWSSLTGILWNFADEPFLAVYTLLGLGGALWCVCGRRFLLPVWLISIFILDPRAAGTDASIPLAMLAALGITQVVLPPLVDAVQQSQSPATEPVSAAFNRQGVAGKIRTILVAGVTVYGLGAASLAPFVPWTSSVVLRPGELQAIQWVRNNTPEASRFLIASGRVTWEIDALSEWFPALADRASLATPQGKEWLEGGWLETIERHKALQRCAQRGLSCFEEWVAEGRTAFDYILVATYPEVSEVRTEGLLEGLATSARYQVVFSNGDATIFAHRPEGVP